MKVTISQNIKALNARVGKPETSSPNPSYKLPGDVLTIDKIEVGSFVDGNAIWYHCCEDECYYWSGGFTETEFNFGNTSLSDFSTNQQSKILISAVNSMKVKFANLVSDYRGIGISDKNYSQILGASLSIYVSKKDNENINVPEFVNYCGVKIPTDVKEVGNTKRSTSGIWDKVRPFRMATSIGPINKDVLGTYTILLEKSDKYYLLSCAHVLLPSLVGNYKRNDNNLDKIVLPKKANNPIIGVVEEGSYNSQFDFAVAQINQDSVANFTNIVSVSDIKVHDYYDEIDQAKSKGRKVFICGSQTNYAEAHILEPFGSRKIGTDKFETLGLMITKRISTHGDSGAPVIDYNSLQIIGFVVANSEDNVPIDKRETLILPIHSIIKNKHYKISTK